ADLEGEARLGDEAMTVLDSPRGAAVKQLARDLVVRADLLDEAQALFDDIEQPAVGRVGSDLEFGAQGLQRQRRLELAEEHVEDRLAAVAGHRKIPALQAEELVLKGKMRGAFEPAAGLARGAGRRRGLGFQGGHSIQRNVTGTAIRTTAPSKPGIGKDFPPIAPGALPPD